MASLDLSDDYQKVKDKITATKNYTNVMQQYNDAKKKAGDSFEDAKDAVSTQIDKAKQDLKRYQREIKNQFEELLDINNVTGGKGSNSIKYVKKTLIKTLRNIQPKIKEILLEEAITAVGCDQQQTFNGQTLYIKVSSVDIGNLLKKDPDSDNAKPSYEKLPIQVQLAPFSMNRELYLRTQNENQSFSQTYNQLYKGESGQDLFDITYVETDNFGQTGPWFKVDLQNRANNVNKVSDFLVDYYKTLNPVEFTNIMAGIMNSLSGAFSFSAEIGLTQVEDATKFELIMSRILGLCFDNRASIDVSGISKISELDGVDNSFFEFTDIDLRNIELKSENIKNGVIQFLDCTEAKLPVDSTSIINSVNQLNFINDGPELDAAADKLTETLTNNPKWAGYALRGNINASVDLNFVKLIVQGLTFALLGPKILLPIMTMLKSLYQQGIDEINGYMDFVKKFRKFIVNLISKIGAIFVKELFKIIKADVVVLIQQVVTDLAKEKANKRIILILKLIQVLLIVAQFVRDWRQCKSVVDELLMLLKVATQGFGGSIPLPLLFGAQLLDGYSETRAFISFIEEAQKLGIPTGPMPDGGPNLDILEKFSMMKSMAQEQIESGKVQIAVPPLTLTPAGITVPQSAYGKYM